MATSVRIRKMTFDYEERVYAGVLGALIGCGLGRRNLGGVRSFSATELGKIGYDLGPRGDFSAAFADDHLAAMLSPARTLAEYNYSESLTSDQIAQSIFNSAIENSVPLWWGGMGHSAAHTAYLNLKKGVPATLSGSLELNGKIVAEQTGAESGGLGWGLLFPGEAERAAAMAGRAASVTHAGEAVFAAQAVAAMVATAFSASASMDTVLDVAASMLPPASAIARMIGDLRRWHASGENWHETRERILETYCGSAFGERHAVPHFAGVVLALLGGAGNLRDSLTLAASAGWGTAANLELIGCVLGVKGGLAEIDLCEAWRVAIDDRIYLPSADAGRCVSDAATEALAICRAGRELHRVPTTLYKKGARFHFELPGSTHGLVAEMTSESPGLAMLHNVDQHSRAGKRCLAIVFSGIDTQRPARISAATCPPRDALGALMSGSPALHAGQTIRAFVEAHAENQFQAGVRPFIRYLGENDDVRILRGPEKWLLPEARHEFHWTLPTAGEVLNPEGTHAIRHGHHQSKTMASSILQGSPIAEIGLEIFADRPSDGVIFLDYLTWDGAPWLELGPPHFAGSAWKSAWVNAATQCDFGVGAQTYRVCQNEGTGLLIQGTCAWRDYSSVANITPILASSAGIAVRVQGMTRYYALLLCPENKLRLVKRCNETAILAEADFVWTYGQTVELALAVEGPRLIASANGCAMFEVEDAAQALEGGAFALVVERGCIESGPVAIGPVE